MFKETLTDTDVENLIVHMQPHDFKAWVTSPDRTDVDFANLVKLARALGKAGVLEDDSPLSQFSINTFWQDMATTFPRMIGYVMLLPTIEERKRVRDSLQGLEVSTGPPCSPIPHYPTLSYIIPHYPTPNQPTYTTLSHPSRRHPVRGLCQRAAASEVRCLGSRDPRGRTCADITFPLERRGAGGDRGTIVVLTKTVQCVYSITLV